MNKVIATTASVTGMVASMVSPASAAGREKTKGTDKPNIVLIIELPENLVDTPETRRQYCNYLAEINLLDKHVGMIDEMLHKYGLADNTVFIFTSEQGYSFPFAKWTLYDEGLQTGVIVRWPGVVEPGSTNDKMCEYVDMTPTIIDIAGGREIKGFDGKSFKQVLLGKGKGKKQVYGIHTTRGIINGSEHYGIRSVRTDRYLYIRNLTPETEFRCAAFNDSFFKSWTEIEMDAFNHIASKMHVK